MRVGAPASALNRLYHIFKGHGATLAGPETYGSGYATVEIELELDDSDQAEAALAAALQEATKGAATLRSI